MLDTWLANDLAAAVAEQDSKTQRRIGSRAASIGGGLGRITARTTVIAGSHDLLFPARRLRGRSRPDFGRRPRFERLGSRCWRHRAGNPRELRRAGRDPRRR